jgi:hypothetical protein
MASSQPTQSVEMSQIEDEWDWKSVTTPIDALIGNKLPAQHDGGYRLRLSSQDVHK